MTEYIFYEDGLYKHFEGAPTPQQRKKPENTKKATEFLELCLVTHITDENSHQPVEIPLNPELSLGHCKRYMFDLIDIEGKSKSMPLFYRRKIK